MFKRLFTKKNNKKEMVMVTYKFEGEENACTSIMDTKALAGMVVNDAYVEIIKVVEL